MIRRNECHPSHETTVLGGPHSKTRTQDDGRSPGMFRLNNQERIMNPKFWYVFFLIDMNPVEYGLPLLESLVEVWGEQSAPYVGVPSCG